MHSRRKSDPGMDATNFRAVMTILCLLMTAGLGRAVSGETRVGIEPPFSVVAPAGALVRIIVANRDSIDVVPESIAYVLVYPPGLLLYRDSERTISLGSILRTRSTGYDTLWATNALETAMDRTYVLSIPTSPTAMTLTFLAGSSSIRRLWKAERPSFGALLHDILGRKSLPKNK